MSWEKETNKRLQTLEARPLTSSLRWGEKGHSTARNGLSQAKEVGRDRVWLRNGGSSAQLATWGMRLQGSGKRCRAGLSQPRGHRWF